MRGNLIELTVGGYLFNQVGIMTGINYTVPMESPWEIGINETSNTGRLKSDSSVKELPFMIKVSGFSFIPIHDFVPSIQKNKFNEKGELISFGKEKYISLSNGYYGDGYKNETQRVESEQANTFVGTEQGQQTIDAIANINFRP
jgi:hypothetical protein